MQVEEGQKEGLKALEEGQEKSAKILYKLDLEEKEWLKTLAEISRKAAEEEAVEGLNNSYERS